jgi:hypothetical protein
MALFRWMVPNYRKTERLCCFVVLFQAKIKCSTISGKVAGPWMNKMVGRWMNKIAWSVGEQKSARRRELLARNFRNEHYDCTCSGCNHGFGCLLGPFEFDVRVLVLVILCRNAQCRKGASVLVLPR